MPLVVVIKPYKFAHQGIRVEEFVPGTEPIETTDECAEQGKVDGAFEDAGAPPAPPPAPAEPPAPEAPPAEPPTAAPAPAAAGKRK